MIISVNVCPGFETVKAKRDYDELDTITNQYFGPKRQFQYINVHGYINSRIKSAIIMFAEYVK